MLSITEPDPRPDTFDVVVLGAGISGLVSASLLLKQGYRNVLVVEEYAHVGGNHIDRSIGEYTFDIGSFIFQDDSPLLAHLPELLPLYVPINPTWGRLNPQGVVTQYPISIKDDLIAAGPVEWLRILSSVLFARIFRRRLRNARDFAQYWIGARLLRRSGLENYMRRFYGLPPESIDIKFAERRMLWIKEHASLRGIFRRWLMPAPKSAANQQLARPREGFSHLYQAAVQRLERDGVTFLLAAKMRGLQKKSDVFFLETGHRCIAANHVVSTIPLERIQNLCGMSSGEPLRTVTLISLFFSFSGVRGFDQSILYNFSHAGSWKRLTVYSDFYGYSAGREFFAVEVNADHVSGSVATAEQDFRRHVSENGLFAGDLKLEGSHIVSNAYPVYTDKADEQAAKAIAALRAIGIKSFGRQGGFDYQPTARDSTLKAEAALRRAANDEFGKVGHLRHDQGDEGGGPGGQPSGGPASRP
jgi:protoporphyrinogen oxidase